MPELNYPGPYELRLYYTVVIAPLNIQHVARYNFQAPLGAIYPAGTPFTDITVQRRVDAVPGVGDDLKTCVDAWVLLFKAMFINTTTIDYAECWRYEEESFNADFVSAYTIGAVGTGGGAAQPGGQHIHTYRTQEGGIMKLNFMESNVSPGAKGSLAAVTGAQATIRDFVVGTDNWFLGRDTSYPFAGINALPGQNEAVWKRRFRG